MRKYLVFVLLLLVLGTPSASAQTSRCDQECIKTVKELLRGQRLGVFTGWHEKGNGRLGDSAAVGIQKIFPNGKALASENIRLYLPIIIKAFQNKQMIEKPENRRPNVTLQLLKRLRTNVDDPILRQEIERTIASLSNTSLNREVKPPWQAASYRGLTAGKSTKADMLEIFGKPPREDSFDNDPDADQIWYFYDNVGEFPGEFTVAVDKQNGLVVMMFQQLINVSREDVIERFGKGYEVTRYDFCSGFDYAESAPVYESERGSAPFMEYRSKGIAVLLDDFGVVQEVSYLAKPVGYSSKNECPAVEAQPAVSKVRGTATRTSLAAVALKEALRPWFF
jgi:hypothetical protein